MREPLITNSDTLSRSTAVGSVGHAHVRSAAEVRPRVVVHKLPAAADELRTLHAGLLAAEPRIASKYFYDRAGCALFSDICGLPEYYLTRTEAAIFYSHWRAIASQLPRGGQWLDVGCGDGRKSYPWLAATAARRYIGIDFAYDGLVHTVDAAGRSLPNIDCLGIATDLSQPFELRPLLAERAAWPPVFFYPGSSLGNFEATGAAALLRNIRAHLDDDGALLMGVDLLKPVRLLEAAYNDSQGVTAAFNRNILRVANRLAGTDFDPGQFEHCAHFAADAGRIEMRLRAREAQTVRIGHRCRRFTPGETILTEYSHKYSIDGVIAMLKTAGFGRHSFWTDPRDWFGIFLARP